MPPFVEDMDDGDVPFPNIGTDLFDNFANFDDDEEPLDSGPVIPDILKEEVAQTVVRIENEEDGGDDSDSDDGGANSDLENGNAAESAIPEAPMDVPAPVSAKKAGRASKAPSRVATPAKTPKSAKATPAKATSAKASGGRKRKAEDDADEPAAKRSGRGRATAAAAREGIKEASKKRARAAPGTVKEAPKAARGRPGRKPKVEKEEPTGEEYEVEEILDYGVDADTKQALFLVKWKGYESEDNTWEPKMNLTHAKELLKEYEANQKKEKKTAKKAAAPTKKPAPTRKASAKAAAKSPAKKAVGRPAAGRPGRRGRPGRPKAK